MGPDKVDTEEATVKLAIKALLEVVQSGGKNLEICVMSEGQKMRMMALPEIEKVVAEVEKEKEEEAAQKKEEEADFQTNQNNLVTNTYFNLCPFARRIGQV